MKPLFPILLSLLLSLLPQTLTAEQLRIATVERPPFSTQVDDAHAGFSVELWQAVAQQLGQQSSYVRHDSFIGMLSAVIAGEADLAVANISITAQREQLLDFSHSIFESGLQIMVPTQGDDSSIWRALLSRDLGLAIGLAFLMLFGGGMLMWWAERGKQSYFDRPAREALFPSFWWALNLVVNGGFEERVPRSLFGRVFGVVLVLSSLFIVSVFVAKITAVMTVDAIQGSVNSVNDLYGKRVGTIEGSTSAAYLDGRDLKYAGYEDLDALIDAFETGQMDAAVFDAPILAYYAAHEGSGVAQMVGAPFRRESYGFALPSGSELVEPINRALLQLRENGTYERLQRKYFGAAM